MQQPRRSPDDFICPICPCHPYVRFKSPAGLNGRRRRSLPSPQFRRTNDNSMGCICNSATCTQTCGPPLIQHPRRDQGRKRSQQQTLAKHAGLSFAFGFAQQLFVSRAPWWRLPESPNRQTMYHRMSSMTLDPFCSSEHHAGSSAWSTILEILARFPSWLAASYVCRSYTPAHPQPCHAASRPVGRTLVPTLRCGSCRVRCDV